MRETMLSAIIGILAVIVVLGLLFGFDAVACEVSTAAMGFPHKYELFAGCMIEPKEGRWIPLENYRFID